MRPLLLPWLLALLGCISTTEARDPISPAVDHHQHFFRTGLPGIPGGETPIDSARLVRLLDEAGISRAAVLSTAYQPGNPNRTLVGDEYEQTKAENDWTSQQVSQFPDRLVGFCGFNPLKDYAIDELNRCANDPNLRIGIKLHFGNSDVRLDDPQHLLRLRTLFAAANEHQMAIVVHLRSSVSQGRPYGTAQARAFLDQVLAAAPDVIVQIAHLAGAGGYDDPATDQVLAVFAEAASDNDPRMTNVYFDVSGVAGFGDWRPKSDQIVQRMRQLGLKRILFGSDGAVPGNSPREAWAIFSQLPLQEQELAEIANNTAPYFSNSGTADR